MTLMAKALAFKGRDSREIFFCYCLATPFLLLPYVILLVLLKVFAQPVFQFINPALQVFGSAIASVAAIILFLAGCRRARDIGWNPWWAALLAIPPLSLAALLLLLSRPGKRDVPFGM